MIENMGTLHQKSKSLVKKSTVQETYIVGRKKSIQSAAMKNFPETILGI
jgi:hypothetical protein